MQQYLSSLSTLIDALETEQIDTFLDQIVTHNKFKLDLLHKPLSFVEDTGSWQLWLQSAVTLNKKLISLVEARQRGLAEQLQSMKSHHQATRSYLQYQTPESTGA